MRQLFVFAFLLICSFALANEVTKKPNSFLCEPCQVGVNVVKDYLAQPDEELLKLFVNGCEMLPDQLQQPCRMAVVMFGKQVLDAARQLVKENSKVICQRFGLCKGKVFPTKKDSPLCPYCVQGATQLKNFLALPDDELLKLVNQVCAYLPSQYRQACIDTINKYGKEFLGRLRALVDGRTPQQLCALLGVCSAKLSRKELQTVEKLPIAFKQDGVFCTPCLMAVQLVKDYLDKPDNELIEMLAQACDLLPDNLKTPCKAMIAVVGKQLIDYVRSHVNDSPREICAHWSLCGKKVETEITQDGVFCTPCLMAVQLVKDYLDKPDNELIEMLAQACDLLPDNLKTPCKAMIAVVGKQLIEYVRSHVNDSPREICAHWSLCGKNTIEKMAQDGILCGPCQLGVQMVKDYLDKPDSELLKMLMEYCDLLPDGVITPCKLAVSMMGPQLIAYVRSHVNDTPREICAKFRLCQKGEKALPIVKIGRDLTFKLNLLKCLKKCLKGWNTMKILKLIKKCKTNKTCYLKEVGQEAFKCVSGCL